jgi:hypothetical protein
MNLAFLCFAQLLPYSFTKQKRILISEIFEQKATETYELNSSQAAEATIICFVQ